MLIDYDVYLNLLTRRYKSMKKLNLLYIFFLLFCFCFSQDFNDKLKNARMGLYFSPAVNFIQTDSDQTETTSKLGAVYGYALEIALNENHRLESGFGIAYKGGNLTESLPEGKINSNYKIQYITLPIFIKMRSREIGYFNYFARIGPTINFKIKEMIQSSENKTTNLAVVDICIFLGAEYSLGGETSLEGSLFFNNNITNTLSSSQEPQALFHQLGVRLGFLF
jgi:hypothetical protein